MFEFNNYSVKSKYYDDSNTLIVRKIKGEIRSVAFEIFVELKPQMCLILVKDSSKYK